MKEFEGFVRGRPGILTRRGLLCYKNKLKEVEPSQKIEKGKRRRAWPAARAALRGPLGKNPAEAAGKTLDNPRRASRPAKLFAL